MEKLSPFKRVMAWITGVLYALMFFTARVKFLDYAISSWLTFAFLLAALGTFLSGNSPAIPLSILGIGIVYRLLFWRAGRDGYIRFVENTKQRVPEPSDEMANYQKFKVRAIGIFSVKERESYEHLKPATCWRVPIGDHAVMVEYLPGRFLYQFVQAGTLRAVKSGCLIYGARPKRALAVTYIATWRPEFAEMDDSRYLPSENGSERKYMRTIYLVFEEKGAMHTVWQSLLRSEKEAVGVSA